MPGGSQNDDEQTKKGWGGSLSRGRRAFRTVVGGIGWAQHARTHTHTSSLTQWAQVEGGACLPLILKGMRRRKRADQTTTGPESDERAGQRTERGQSEGLMGADFLGAGESAWSMRN